MNAKRRGMLFAAPFVALAIASIGYAGYSFVIATPPSWTLVLAVIAGVILCGPLQMQVGRMAGHPVVGVSVAMLAILPTEHSPLLSVGIWSIGVAISQAFARRSLMHALYATGVGTACACAFMATLTALTALGIWLFPRLLLASAAYYSLMLLIELTRQWGRGTLDGGSRIASVSLVRIGAVVLGVAAIATLMHYVDGALIPWLEQDPDASLTPFVVLLTASCFYVLAQRKRTAETDRRLRAVVEAAVELPRETDGALASALKKRVRAIVRAGEVEFVDRAPEYDEIGATVSLEAGVEQYMIASRKIGGTTFTREDERVLATLAHMASEAARFQYEVDTLERRANSDPLTGLPNYGAFQAALVAANEHRPYHEVIALLFIDLDHFKDLNDNFGHRAGDELLRAVADRLQEAAGGGDVVSRVGGDEFVVILSGLVSLEQAKASAERIIEAVSRPLALEGHDMRPVVSAGLAFSSHRELDAQTLVEDADRTMLHAKRSRRRTGPAEASSVSVSSHRSTRTNDIVARAIRERRVGLAFQPIVDMERDEVWAFEALLRYVDPELGPVSPPSFVARAKRLGLMNELTRQVIEKALEAAEKFHSIAPAVNCMTVNLELGQISEAELGPFIRDAARAHPDVSLCIELNERSLRSVTDDLRRDAESLQAAGVIIALDDYGSDDSPVGALVHFPMNVVKIDKSLISNLADARQREVIKALQGFSDNLGYTTVIEGVEDSDTASVLTALGARGAQGYYFGRPMPLLLASDRLRRWGARAVIQ